MKRDIQKKAVELSNLIDSYNKSIKEIDEVLKSDKKIRVLNVELKWTQYTVKDIRVDSDDIDIDIIDTAGRMSLRFILEVYKKKLERLELEYANL